MASDPENIAAIVKAVNEAQQQTRTDDSIADLNARVSVLEKTAAREDRIDKLENRLMRWILGTAFGLVTAALAIIALVFNFCNPLSG